MTSLPFLPQEIIRIKRDGGTLSPAQIRQFVAGITAGTVAEGQIGAFNMAVFLRGMTVEECVAFTLAMRDSGDICDWSATGINPATIIDKHSTGGVGDEKASLLIVPLVAACGIHMPMISARGLGHTGGEVDLVEAIPGYQIAPPLETFMAAVCRAGCALIGPTPRLAPADIEIYRVRDVTATVESIPLITGSIMAKKLASGISGLVMTVNFGVGAFMQTHAQAEELANSMLGVASGANLPAIFLLGPMDDVVGDAIGSRLQLREVADFFRGDKREARLNEIVLRLSAEILVLGKLAPDLASARALAQARLDDGSAAAKFSQMVAELGGPASLLDRMDEFFVPAPVIGPIPALQTGFIHSVDARQVGLAMVGLGAGRRTPQQALDHDVGLTGMVHIGHPIQAGQPLCTLHARSQAAFEAAAQAIAAAITIGTQPVPPSPVFAARITNLP